MPFVWARRGHQNPWDWSYRWLWVMWVLGIKLQSSARASSILNQWAISVLTYFFLKIHSSADERLGWLCNSGSCEQCCDKHLCGYLFDAMTFIYPGVGLLGCKVFLRDLCTIFQNSYTLIILLSTIYNSLASKSQLSSYTYTHTHKNTNL